MQTANVHACACCLPECLLNGCIRQRQTAAVVRGCICPPGSEVACKRWDCGRRGPGSATSAAATSQPGTPEGVNQTILPQTEKGS